MADRKLTESLYKTNLNRAWEENHWDWSEKYGSNI